MAFPQQGRWGIYDVTALIGEGGMGQVYQATGPEVILVKNWFEELTRLVPTGQ